MKDDPTMWLSPRFPRQQTGSAAMDSYEPKLSDLLLSRRDRFMDPNVSWVRGYPRRLNESCLLYDGTGLHQAESTSFSGLGEYAASVPAFRGLSDQAHRTIRKALWKGVRRVIPSRRRGGYGVLTSLTNVNDVVLASKEEVAAVFDTAAKVLKDLGL